MRHAISSLVALALVACGGTGPSAESPSPPPMAAEPAPSDALIVTPSDPKPMTMAEEPEAGGRWDVVDREPQRRPRPEPTLATGSEPDTSRLLPEDFTVFVRGNTVINHPQPGFEPRVLPTVNDFRGSPGCYVACYSHDAKRSVYGVGGTIYVMGQVRVPGHYEGRVCLPQRYGRADISAAQGIKELCKASIPACGDGCWGGGDTGGWFGVQPSRTVRP